MTDSRRYLKRVWRVPKDRGAAECFAALCLKMLRRHGWPAVIGPNVYPEEDFSFDLQHDELGYKAPPDFWQAVSIAVRIQAAQSRVYVREYAGHVVMLVPYDVNERGEFKERKNV
jgi:hypothetical protein